jgi:hypothetical protein
MFPYAATVRYNGAVIREEIMRPRLWKGILAAVALVLAAVPLVASAQGIPSLPVLYKGQVSVGGEPAPDGLLIFARILDYETAPVEVEDGQYRMLQVAPPSASYAGKEIVFYATYGFGEVQALERAIYRIPDLTVPGSLTPTKDLSFPQLPPPPPTPTLTPTPTVTPTPTMTPTPTPALPIPGDPTVGTLAVWVLVAGALALVGGLVVLRLARARRS